MKNDRIINRRSEKALDDIRQKLTVLNDKIQEPSTELFMSFPIPGSVKEFHNVNVPCADGSEITMDIYRPKCRKKEKLPVVTIFHSGGLYLGTPIFERFLGAGLAEAGFLVLVPPHDILDSDHTVRDILGSAFRSADAALSVSADYGGDTKRVFLLGNSAGAFPALYAAAASKSDKIADALGCRPEKLDAKGIITVSGMIYTEKKDFIGNLLSIDLYRGLADDKGFMKFMNPENPEVISSLPPMLLVSSGEDFLGCYTQKYGTVLKSAHHPCSVMYYPYGVHLIHSFSAFFPFLPESRDMYRNIRTWADRQ